MHFKRGILQKTSLTGKHFIVGDAQELQKLILQKDLKLYQWAIAILSLALFLFFLTNAKVSFLFSHSYIYFSSFLILLFIFILTRSQILNDWWTWQPSFKDLGLFIFFLLPTSFTFFYKHFCKTHHLNIPFLDKLLINKKNWIFDLFLAISAMGLGLFAILMPAVFYKWNILPFYLLLYLVFIAIITGLQLSFIFVQGMKNLSLTVFLFLIFSTSIVFIATYGWSLIQGSSYVDYILFQIFSLLLLSFPCLLLFVRYFYMYFHLVRISNENNKANLIIRDDLFTTGLNALLDSPILQSSLDIIYDEETVKLMSKKTKLSSQAQTKIQNLLEETFSLRMYVRDILKLIQLGLQLPQAPASHEKTDFNTLIAQKITSRSQFSFYALNESQNIQISSQKLVLDGTRSFWEQWIDCLFDVPLLLECQHVDCTLIMLNEDTLCLRLVLFDTDTALLKDIYDFFQPKPRNVFHFTKIKYAILYELKSLLGIRMQKQYANDNFIRIDFIIELSQ